LGFLKSTLLTRHLKSSESSVWHRLKNFRLRHVPSVVFVHGLEGHPYKTWVGKKNKVFWPAELLPKDLLKRKENVRILVYGYNADVYAFGGSKTSSDRILNHAQTLVQTLYANRSVS
jgi:hypothetical protein